MDECFSRIPRRCFQPRPLVIKTIRQLLVVTILGVFVVSCEMNEHLFLDTKTDINSDSETDNDKETDSKETDSKETDSETVQDAVSIAAEMGMGTGIASTLDNTSSWETGWGLPRITQAFINGMAENGIKTIRLPVAWDTYAVNGVIQDDKMARVREVVMWILAADMYCIVDIHWDRGWINSEGTENEYQLTDKARTKFQSYWQQIAEAFADVENHLVFEAMNDEAFYMNGDSSGAPDYAPLNELNQLFVNTVRAGGGANGTRNLVVSGFNTDIEKTCVDDFAIPTDPAGAGLLFLSVHYFSPYTFCLLEQPVNQKDEEFLYPTTTWGSDDDMAEMQRLFDLLAAFSAERNLPVIVGEFSATRGREEYVRDAASRVLWMKSVIEAALSHGMVPLLWDGGTEISRTDGSFAVEFAQVMSELGF